MEERPDRFTVFADANVLVPILSRNLILTLAEAGLYRLRLSEPVLVELERAIPRANPAMTTETAQVQVERIRQAFPEAIVEAFDHLHRIFDGAPDPDDVHVLAAAFKCDAAVIVTENLKDFPADLLARHGMQALGADDVLADAIDIDQARACAAVRRMRLRFRRPEIDPASLVDLCRARGLPLAASLLASNLDAI